MRLRAWGKLNERIYPVTQVSRNAADTGWLIYSDGKFLGIAGKECELMQYTGLKDKNGVEIYEGDIVGLGDKTFYKVQWIDNEAMFEFVDANGDTTSDIFSTYVESYEVIGNVYENPELLKKEGL